MYIRSCLRFLLLAFMSFPASIYAAFNNVELSIQGGISQLHLQGDYQISPTQFETDALQQTNQMNSFLWAVGVGYKFLVGSLVDNILLGVNLYHFSTVAEGNVYQYGLSEFNNYSYRLPINSTRLMLDGKFFTPEWQQFSLFVVGGLGVAWNKLGYSEAPMPDIVDINTRLDNHSSTQFAYELGAGLQYSMTQHLSFSVEYLFANLGDAATATQGNKIFATPADFRLYTHAGLLGLHWKF